MKKKLLTLVLSATLAMSGITAVCAQDLSLQAQQALALQQAQVLAIQQAQAQAIAQAQAQAIAQAQAQAQAQQALLLAQAQAMQAPVPAPAIAPTVATPTPTVGNVENADYFNTYNIPEQQQTDAKYVLNISTHKFHIPSCNEVSKIKPENYQKSKAERDEVVKSGFSPCGKCKP